MSRSNWHNLLIGYLNNTLTTKEELEELKITINNIDDDELGDGLGNIWNEYECEEIDTAIKNNMLNEISQNIGLNVVKPIRKPKKRSLYMSVFRVAMLFALVFMGFQVFRTNNEINKLEDIAKQEIRIVTGKGERSKIELPDGTVVILNNETELSYPNNFGNGTRTLSLSGEALFKVAKNKEKTFVVNTEFLEVEVLGTEFNINAYSNCDYIKMSLLSGNIKVTTKAENSETAYMEANESVTFSKKTGKLHRSSGNRDEVAWVNKSLVLRSKPLGEVFNILEKWYGVKIYHNIPEKLISDLFTGSFDNKEVSEVIKILTEYYNFSYRISGYNIYIDFIN